ncbi:rod-binding protein [Dethiothermospora halolimnae]|uniref:rod-binding protein n=1 Tax=Dethiothermospora halolimnae TaxID=3114390 RepID=UPI003CCBBDA7
MDGINNINTINTINNSKIKSENNKLKNLQKSSDSIKNDKELMEVCKDFESIFTNMMLKEMRNTIPKGGLTEKSRGREIFEDMYYDEMSKNISKNDNGIGLAKILYEQFKGVGYNK